MLKIKTLCLASSGTGSSLLFAGTNQGLYYSADEGENWRPYYNGLPRGTVTTIEYQAATRTLFCGLYGRGIYKISIAHLLRRENIPEIKITIPRGECEMAPIEGSTIELSCKVDNPGVPGPFTIRWFVDGANGEPGETFEKSKCRIEIPAPAVLIMVTVEITFSDGWRASRTIPVPTVTQDIGKFMTFICRYKNESLKPIPWWEWDPAMWSIDPKTNLMQARPVTRKELMQVIRTTKTHLQNLQKMLEGMGK